MANVYFVTVSKWGLSLGLRIPKELVEKLGIKEGEKLKLTESKNSFSAEKAIPTKEMYYI